MKTLLATLVFAVLAALVGGAAAQAEVTYRGKLEVRHVDDFPAGRSDTAYTLVSHRHRIAVLPTVVPNLDSGTPVKVRGRRVGHFIKGRVRASGHARVHKAAVLGPHKVAVLLFNFTSDTSQPWTPDYVRQRIFTDPDSTSAFYREESYGDVWLTGKVRSDGDVFGWYTISGPTAGCDVDLWASQARSAAASAGVDLSGYDNVIYAFPDQASCDWAGLGELPGTQSWVNGDISVRVVAHELGHNMGLHHASSYSCTSGGAPVAIGGSCSASEYGDRFDVMGSTPRRGNAWHLDQLGYLSAGNVQTVTSSGTYTLTATEGRSSGVQLLRIPRPPLTGGGAPEYYDLELRTSAGVFDNWSSTEPVVNGVTIHVDPDPSIVTQSLLLDTTPGSANGFLDAALGPGRTFSDGTVSVTTRSISAGTATVDVAFSAPPPDSTAPSAPTGVAATAVSSGVTLTWGAATDNVGVAGYRIERNGSLIAQTPASSFFDSGVLPASLYAYRVIAYDAAGNATPSAPVTVTTPGGGSTPPPPPPSDSTPPRVGILSPLQGSRVRRIVRVRVVGGDDHGVVRLDLYIDGVRRAVARSASAAWLVRGVRVGRHVVAVRAFDAAGNAAAKSVRFRVVR